MRLAVTDYLLVLLTLAVGAGAIWLLRRALNRAHGPIHAPPGAAWWAGLAAAAWLTLTAALAERGVLREWQALPPRLLLVVVPPVILTVFLLRSRRVGALLDSLPVAALVAPQVFRVAVELLLWRLYREGRIPVQMTFEGRNWDILVGLTAPVVAVLVARHRFGLARIWNGAGLVILANIVVVAILSAPLPFRQFMNEPANTVIADFPWVWLPGVLVPVAYALHLLSWRQVARRAADGAPR